MFGSRESERKKERKKRDKRENKSKTKIKTIYLQKAVNLQITKILQRPQFTTDPPSLLQNMRGIYKPPQGMKLPKTLVTKLSYRIGE